MTHSYQHRLFLVSSVSPNLLWCPVVAGREGREGFGAASGLKKKKTGGTSNREKAKRKNMPAAARVRQISRRTKANRRPKGSFKGHVKGSNFDRSRK